MMSVVTPPGDPNRSRSYSSSSSPMSTKAKVALAIIAVWAVVVGVALPSFELGDVLFGVISPVIGLVLGAFSGLFVGFGTVAHILSWVVLAPVPLAAVLGAFSGAITAWLLQAYNFKNKLARSFISSVFSKEIWEGNGMGFICQLLVSTVVGYVIAAGFSSIGMFDDGTNNLGAMAHIMLGGGSGGGNFEGEFISLIIVIFATLAALLIAGGVVGGCTGGIIGGAIGAGLSSIGINTVTQGAVEEIVFQFFAPYRPKDTQSGRFNYFLVGALTGVGDSVLTGVVVGAVLFIARFFGN